MNNEAETPLVDQVAYWKQHRRHPQCLVLGLGKPEFYHQVQRILDGAPDEWLKETDFLKAVAFASKQTLSESLVMLPPELVESLLAPWRGRYRHMADGHPVAEVAPFGIWHEIHDDAVSFFKGLDPTDLGSSLARIAHCEPTDSMEPDARMREVIRTRTRRRWDFVNLMLSEETTFRLFCDACHGELDENTRSLTEAGSSIVSYDEERECVLYSLSPAFTPGQIERLTSRLLPFASHKNPWSRFWAACRLCEISPNASQLPPWVRQSVFYGLKLPGIYNCGPILVPPVDFGDAAVHAIERIGMEVMEAAMEAAMAHVQSAMRSETWAARWARGPAQALAKNDYVWRKLTAAAFSIIPEKVIALRDDWFARIPEDVRERLVRIFHLFYAVIKILRGNLIKGDGRELGLANIWRSIFFTDNSWDYASAHPLEHYQAHSRLLAEVERLAQAGTNADGLAEATALLEATAVEAKKVWVEDDEYPRNPPPDSVYSLLIDHRAHIFLDRLVADKAGSKLLPSSLTFSQATI